jgi:hypothetical protein
MSIAALLAKPRQRQRKERNSLQIRVKDLERYQANLRKFRESIQPDAGFPSTSDGESKR